MNPRIRGLVFALAVVCLGLAVLWQGRSRHGSDAASKPNVTVETPVASVSTAQQAQVRASAAKPWDYWHPKVAAARAQAATPANAGERDAPFVAFRDWMARHAAGKATVREGVALGRVRREAMARWIREDPRFALEMAVPRDARAGLPVSVLQVLETPFSGRGDFEVLIVCGRNVTREDEFRRSVIMDGERQDAFVYGRRASQATKYDIPLHGISLGGKVALHESPVRRLEPREAAGAGFGPNVIPLHVGDEVKTAVSDRDAQAIEANHIAAESVLGPHVRLAGQRPSGSSGGGSFPPGTMAFPPTPSHTFGNKRMLFIRIDFSDDTTVPVTVAGVNTLMVQVNQFYLDNSKNQTSITSSNIPVVLRMPQPKSFYAGASVNVLRTDALAAARTYDAQNGNTGAFNPDTYNLDAVVFTSINGGAYGFAGLATVGGKGMWVNGSFTLRVLAHEIGHNYGLLHANRWDVTGTNPIDPGGTHNEYGDDYDMMGANNFNEYIHFNEWFKSYLLWIPAATGWRTASTGGVYRIFRHDSAISTGVRAVTLGQQSDRAYWLGFRRQDPTDVFLSNGLEIRWGMQPPGLSSDMTAGARLLNMNPTVANFTQHPLPLGQTFADTNLSFFITPTVIGGSFSNEYIDVNISYSIPPPTITTNPASQTVLAGASVTFNVAATGTGPFTFQWFFNGVSLPGATSSNLTLNGVTTNQAGNYTVSVGNNAGTVTSQPATLTVLVLPAITAQPVSQTVTLGSNATFTVTATGTAPLRYQWAFNAGNIANATNATLVLNNVQLAQAGNYSVAVTNLAGATNSAIAVLTVTGGTGPPVIVQQPLNVMVNAGQSATFFVGATGLLPLTYQWTQNGVSIPNATNSVFTRPAVTALDAGIYAVVVSNSLGTATSANAFLTVGGPPQTTVFITPSNTLASLGQSVTLSFTPPNGATTIQWYRGAAPGPSPGLAPIAGATNSTLTLTNLAVTNSGIYSVQVGGTFGLFFSSPGGDAVVNVVPFDLSGSPSPVAHWRFDEDCGPVALDSAGVNHAFFSPTGAAIVTNGIVRGALSLSRAANGFATAGRVFDFTNSPYSLVAWVKLTAGDTRDTVLLSKRTPGTNDGYELGVNPDATTGTGVPPVGFGQTNKARFYASNPTNGVASTTTLNDGNWHQIVVTYFPPVITNGSGLAMFVDGAPVESNAVSSFAVSSVRDLVLGGRFNGTTTVGALDGLLDEVQIYNRVLTDTEIDFLFPNPGLEAQNTPGATAPVIVSAPQSRTVTAGTTVNFSVTAVAVGAMRYQWLFNGMPIAGANGSTLTFTGLPSSAGRYSVAVFTEAGSACSLEATLTVNVPPVILSPPQSQVVVAGSTVVLGVNAGGTAPLSYIWRKNGINLPAPPISSFTLQNVQAADAGNYDVVVYNSAGATLSTPANISIFGAPTINVQPQGQSVLPGASVTFTVSATGTAPLGYQWRKNGVNIPGANSPSFQIFAVTGGDVGAYSVVVSNAGGSLASQDAVLGLVGAPVITQHPVSTTLPAGVNAVFTTAATGTAPLAYQWLFNENAIPGATTATLVISNASIASEGAYRVVVSNAVGTASSSPATLAVTIAPEILQPPQPAAVPAGGTAAFSVVAIGTAPPLTYQWRLNGTNIAHATGASITINNVSPASLGIYSVVVADGRGSVVSPGAQLSLGNANPEVVLFDGSTVTNFHPRGFPASPVQWIIVPTNALEVVPAVGDLDSFALFNDFQLHVEFRTETPTNIFQSDVGIHLQGRYEIQIRESFGQVALDSTNCGAIFGVRAPDSNASLPAGQWQAFDITFRSARWNGTTKIANARVTVVHNGVLVHNDVEIPDRTFNANFETPTPGPIRLLGGIPRVQYRNVRVTPLDVPPVFQYALGSGGGGDEFIRGLARDASGNLYIAGAFSGSVTLGNFAFNTRGQRDILLAKLDSAGNVVWARQAGGSGSDFGHGVAVDAAGNVFLAGSFQGTAQWDSPSGPGVPPGSASIALTSTGQLDGFLAKYDAAGNLLWVRSGGGSGNDAAYAVGADAAGNAYIAGDFSGTANFGAVVLTSAGGLDGFVAKYDAAGNPLWAVRHGGTGDTTTSDLKVDASGIFICGSFPNTAAFGLTQLTSRGSNDAFFAKLDAHGAFQWARQFGGPNDDLGHGIAVGGPDGAVHVAGQFSGTVTNGTNGLISTFGPLNDEIFVGKFDSNGLPVWTRQAGGVSNDVAFGVAVDVPGNVFITGMIGGPATFSSTPVVSAGGDDLFVAKFNAAGVIQWVKTAGGAQDGVGRRIVADAVGNAYIAGGFAGNEPLDSFNLVSGGQLDFFLTKLGNAVASVVAPAIVLQPQNRAVSPGAQVTFSVSATGTQPLDYQWLLNGVDIPGATAQTFTVAAAQVGHAGIYTVVVSNAAGIALSSPARLSILGPPVITQQPEPTQTVNPGSTVTLVVAATGTDPLGFIWRRNSTNINAPSLPSLVLNNIQPSDAGAYDVTVFNAAGVVVSAGATVAVRPLPVFSAQPASQSVALGGAVTFTVVASGTGGVNFQWRKNGQALAGENGSSLTRLNVQVADGGGYDVVVTDSIGSLASATATLVVLVPPVVVQQPVGLAVVGGTNVQLTAVFTGNPPPVYQWFRFGIAVTNATNATLVLTNVTTNVSGLYTIRGTNVAGSATSAGALLTVVRSLVLPPPLPPPGQLQSNGFAFSVAVEPGRIYRVQASTNLVTWTDIGFVVGSGGLVQSFLDAAVSNRPNRFYRVVTP
jgi:hypothetical protein